MPTLLAIDVLSLFASAAIATALLLMAIGAGPSRPLTRSFLYLGITTIAWSVASLLLRLSLWSGIGNSLPFAELSLYAYFLLGPFLLLFSFRYSGLHRWWLEALMMGALGVTGLAGFPLFAHRLLGAPALLGSGATVVSLRSAGVISSIVPGLCMGLAVYLLWRRSRTFREALIPSSAMLLFLGYAAGLILQEGSSVLPITTAIGMGVLGWGVARRQLFNPLRERAERLELLARVGRSASRLLDLDQLLAQAVTLVRDAFSYYCVGILLAEGEELALRASTLLSAEQCKHLRLKIGREGITGWVAGTGEPANVADVRTDPHYVSFTGRAEARSELAVPIRLGEQVIGVLDAQSMTAEAFDDADLLNLQTIADQLATAIGNARLYEQASRRAERLALAGRISAAVSGTLDLDTLMETVRREVTPVFGADAFSIALYDRESDELDNRVQVDEGVRERPGRAPVGSGLAAWIVREGRPLLVRDTGTELKGLPQSLVWGAGKLPLSWLGVPMRLGGELVGVLSVQTYGPRHYDEDDQKLLASIGDQVAIAVGNARQYETARRELAERERTARTLLESEKQFRDLAEQSPNMIFIFGARRFLYANRRCEQVMGWSRDEASGSGFSWKRIVAPACRLSIIDHYRRRLQGEEASPLELALVTREGQQLEAILTTTQITYGGVRAVMGILTDITARKHTERLLQSLNMASLAMMQSMSPDEILPMALYALASVGFNAAVLFLDDARTKLVIRYGIDREGHMGTAEEGAAALSLEEVPILGRVIHNEETLLADLDGSPLVAWRSVRNLLPGGLPAAREAERQSGQAASEAASPFGARVIFAPLHVGGEVFGVLAVEAEKYAEEDLQAVTAFGHAAAAGWRKTALMSELSRSLDELKRTQERLLHSQKMEAVGRLAGGIAHDFNNLLTVISGYTGLLADTLDGDREALAKIAEIRNAILRAASLTGRLVAFSRKQALQPVVLDLNAAVAGSEKLLRPLLGEDIELAVSLAPRPGRFRADAGQFEQVIVNLAVNARDAMSAGGRIEIETASVELEAGDPRVASDLPAGSWVVLTVRDNGAGMSEETKSHLFEPFFTTKEDGKGSGLGLSTVYGIVKQCGGAIRVESSPGKGTVFTIYFPRVSAPLTVDAEAPRARHSRSGSGTVLVVEDERIVRELAARILQEAGYRTLVASGPQEAIRVAESETGDIDVLLTDLVMPGGMTGVELAEQLSRARPRLQAVYMSGYATEEAAARFGVPEGGARFLAKPFEPGELLALVAAAVATPRS